MSLAVALLIAGVQVNSVSDLPPCDRKRNGRFVEIEGDQTGTFYLCDATLGMWLKIVPKKKEETK